VSLLRDAIVVGAAVPTNVTPLIAAKPAQTPNISGLAGP
jgi:hypothetical protein